MGRVGRGLTERARVTRSEHWGARTLTIGTEASRLPREKHGRALVFAATRLQRAFDAFVVGPD